MATLKLDIETRGGDVAQGIFQGIGQSIANAGIALVSAGIDAAFEAIGNSITLASDKAEAASRVNVLFGESADIVARASEGAAEAVGLSSGAYLQTAGDLGNLITNLGYTGDEAANMSVEMVALAADMGSFNNASTQEVTEAMGAAFRGETEPIRRFGVMLSDAEVKAKALELGLYSGVGALDKNAKATATYQLILEQTTSAQGDFARTADGLANSQKIAGAQMEDAWTRVGEAIMPLAQQVLPMLADAVVWAVDTIMDLWAAIGEWADDNQELLDSLMNLAGVIGGHLKNAFDLLMAVVGELGYRLGGLLGVFIDLGGAIVDFGDAIIRALNADFEGAAAAAERGLDRIGSFAENVQRAMGDTGRRAADQLAIDAANAASIAEETGQDIEAQQRANYQVMAANAAGGTRAIGTESAAGAAAGLRAGTPAVEGAARTMGATIPRQLTEAQREARRIANQTPGEIADGLRSQRGAVTSAMEQLKNDMKNAIEPAKEIAQLEGQLSGKAIARGLNSTDPLVRASAQNTVDVIQQRIATLQGIAFDVGSAAGQAVVRGLNSTIPAVRGYAEQAARALAANLRPGSPTKEGPLSEGGGIEKWMQKLGQQATAGFAQGSSGLTDTLGSLGSGIGPLGLTATPGAWVHAGARGGGASYYITVQSGVGDPVAIGRDVVNAIGAFERSNGREWRAN